MKLTILLPCFLLSACVAACSKDDSAEIAPVDRTVMVYMAADNDLWGDALADLEEMQRGFTETGAKLVAFLDLPGEQPCIMEISPASSAKVHTYEEISSADPAQLRRVVSDMVAMYPAARYGLVLWSHGASWLPAGVALKSFAPSEAFSRSDVQRLDVYGEQYHFDLLDFVRQAFPDADLTAFAAQLSRAVLYKNHTPEFIGQYAIRTYCGLSCNIPHPARRDLNEYYNTLQWSIDLNNTPARQGEAPEVQPRGSALPP